MVVCPLALMDTETNALATEISKTPKADPSVPEHMFLKIIIIYLIYICVWKYTYILCLIYEIKIVSLK